MLALREHPALQLRRGPFEPMTEEHKLAVRLRHLLSLDSNAVYLEQSSVIVYYVSPHAAPHLPREGCGRIVLAPDGATRRIDHVGFDPRTAVLL